MNIDELRALIKLHYLEGSYTLNEFTSRLNYNNEFIKKLILSNHIEYSKSYDTGNKQEMLYRVNKKKILELIKKEDIARELYVLFDDNVEIIAPDIYNDNEIRKIKKNLKKQK